MSTTGEKLVDLWNRENQGPQGWIATCSTEQKAWLDEIADLIVKRGSEPVWAKVQRRFEELWPDGSIPAHTTMSTAIRRLVKTRG